MLIFILIYFLSHLLLKETQKYHALASLVRSQMNCLVDWIQFVGLETIVTGLVDKYAKTLRPRKIYFILGLCVLMYLIGLSMVTEVCLQTVAIYLIHCQLT